MTLDPRQFVQAVEGSIPIVLSSGHDGTKAIEGCLPRRDPWATTCRDVGATRVLQGIAAHLPAQPHTVVCTASRSWIDVNRPRADSYEYRCIGPIWTLYHRSISTALSKARKQAKAAKAAALLIDIHGTVGKGFDVALGNFWGFASGDALAEAWAGSLASDGFTTWLNHPRFSGGWTIKLHGRWATGLDAIQIEVSRALRDDPPTLQRLCRSIASLACPRLGVDGSLQLCSPCSAAQTPSFAELQP